MPSDKSIYRKIQVILEIARSKRVNTLNELKDLVVKRQPQNFLVKRYSEAKDKKIDEISTKSIKKTVNFCVMLSLIDGDGILTDNGKKALQEGLFEKIITKQINNIISDHEINKVDINKFIRTSLKNDPPILPTAAEIWTNHGEGKINFNMFNRLLTLLTLCRGADSSQKKIYLKID